MSPEAPHPTTSTRRRVEIALFAVVVIVAVALGTVLLTSNGDDSSTSAGNGPAAISDEDRTPAQDGGMGPLGDLSRRNAGDPMAIGDVDAPVVMVEFADYRCPFCAKFSDDIEPELIDRYVDSGQLRIEWRDMPIYGDESKLAASAARAAAEQGKFWEFNSTLYAAAPDNGHPEMNADKLRGFAEDAGVPDMEDFTEQMNSDKYDDAIQADMVQAQKLGIPATPAFSINGYPILGAQPLPKFTQKIDALLDDQQGQESE